ncbi:MAG TPA: glycine cleavage system aminomethyltransferase GcvT [Candidatus Dormibacteraeota bacterium]|nr:glycine cleavage system aminomethyltransferase GcvT [Candidatus Dormibacteraeota bacterium]
MRVVATTKSCSLSSTRTRSTSTTWSTASRDTNRTPLYDRHLALGGRMVDFGGWEMPQQYTSIRDEHLAVRKAAGLFDVSHMGRFRLRGEATSQFLQGLVTNDVAQLQTGQAQYNLLCTEQGGIVDDLVVYRGEEGFFVVVNASNREKDLEWFRGHAPAGVEVDDRTFELALIAFQGPRAQDLLPSRGLDDLAYFGFRRGEVAGVPALISRTGYTGEDGFELFVDSGRVGEVWNAILDHGRTQGVLPAGLGARDATRLEAALRLWGNDMDESVNPYEAGLGWTVKLEKGDFIGRQALQKVKAEGPGRRLVGLKMQPGDIARHGAAVSAQGAEVGVITSGTHSFFLGHPIALAMVEARSLQVGDRAVVEVRGREAPAEIVKLPFYRGSARSLSEKKESRHG